MIITPLWHTEFLVDIANEVWENVRILVDSWLSDYAVGDMMERTTKVRLDPEKISTIDAIYISHAHTDHFDPYTLVEIYGTYPPPEKGELEGVLFQKSEQTPPNLPFSREGWNPQKPILILPFTLRYLESIISEYLPSARVKWLGNRETLNLKWIEITWYMWPNPEITNEDDVMMIAISSYRELVFAEIDTISDPYDEEVQKSLYKVFTRKNYETACYIASRNCLEWLIPYYDLTENRREAYRAKYIADQKEGILANYEKYDYEEYAHFSNLYTLPGFIRGYVGQGIAYPRSLSEELYALSIFPLDEIASIESDYARNAGYEFSQKALLAGRQYKLENGTIEQGRKECPIGILDNELQTVDNRSESRRQSERIYASWPLFPWGLSIAEIEEGKVKILEILNSRFLSYWSASPVASLRDVLIKNDGVYRISFSVSVSVIPGLRPLHSETKHGSTLGVSRNLEGKNESSITGFLPTQEWQKQQIIYEYSTARTWFIEVPYADGMKIDEDYWILDLIDFLEGRQEMYSSFWHRLDPKKIYRLWTCLGTTYMNHDLVAKKYRLHFERAREWFTSKEFVETALVTLIWES
jgi:hypothetical protein